MIKVVEMRNNELNYEHVERKGLGHPDTICDAIAELTSRYYSQYFLEKYNKYAHHWFDKVMLIGGESHIDYGVGKLIKPYKLIFAGKCVKEFEGNPIPLKEIYYKASAEILNAVLYKFDFTKDLEIIDETVDHQGSSRQGNRYRPQSIEELVDKDSSRVSNDCNMLASFAPLSKLEEIVINLEKLLTSKDYRMAHPEIGSDIKIVGVRNEENYKLLVNAPFIADFIKSYSHYLEVSETTIIIIKKFIRDNFSVECDIEFNPSDRENKPYLTSLGSAADTGDVGVVGRGNRINGLITPMRCMSIEAPSGKNPIDHTGKLYAIVADRISKKVYGKFNYPVETYIFVSKSTSLSTPNEILIKIKKENISLGEEELISAIVNEEMNSVYDLTEEIVKIGVTMW